MGDNTMHRRWPIHGWLGLFMAAIFWLLNWTLPGLRTQWAFFPLWLGYCLTVDAMVYWRLGNSLLTNSPKKYASLFLISAPVWWLFEVLNWRTQNWLYVGREAFSDVQYFLLASLSFSTVMPAVFSSTQLFLTFDWLKNRGKGPIIPLTRGVVGGFFAAGNIMLVLLGLWPQLFFPFLWLSLFFIIEPINVWRGSSSVAAFTARGEWRPVIALWMGCLLTAFFWEMWNFYSYPKWIYQIPYADFLYLFEMPLLGYGGYMPFALELYAIYWLLSGLMGASPVNLFGSSVSEAG